MSLQFRVTIASPVFRHIKTKTCFKKIVINFFANFLDFLNLFLLTRWIAPAKQRLPAAATAGKPPVAGPGSVADAAARPAVAASASAAAAAAAGSTSAAGPGSASGAEGTISSRLR